MWIAEQMQVIAYPDVGFHQIPIRKHNLAWLGLRGNSDQHTTFGVQMKQETA